MRAARTLLAAPVVAVVAACAPLAEPSTVASETSTEVPSPVAVETSPTSPEASGQAPEAHPSDPPEPSSPPELPPPASVTRVGEIDFPQVPPVPALPAPGGPSGGWLTASDSWQLTMEAPADLVECSSETHTGVLGNSRTDYWFLVWAHPIEADVVPDVSFTVHRSVPDDRAGMVQVNVAWEEADGTDWETYANNGNKSAGTQENQLNVEVSADGRSIAFAGRGVAGPTFDYDQTPTWVTFTGAVTCSPKPTAGQ